MKKVLILANNDVGLYKFRKELIEKLDKEENKVYISLPNGELVEKLTALGCNFIETNIDRRGINPVTDFKLFINYIKMTKKIKPDCIITYTVKPNIYGGLVSRLKKIPYIVNITGLGTAFQNDGFLKKLITTLYKSALKKSSRVFFENSGNKDIFINENIIKEEKATVLNGAGVNLEDYPFEEMPTENPVRFLFIGRVMKEKGIDELFSVAKKIKQEYENVEFDIVGPFEDNYKEIVENLVSEKVINFHGYQKDVKPFIKNCHCFVLPSYHEGMANTLLESASMGRPLITSNIHGCKEAVSDNGFLITPKDEKSLYEAVKKFIDLSKEEKEKMSKASRELMEQVFDKQKVVEKSMMYIREM